MHVPRVICVDDATEMLIFKTGAVVEMVLPEYNESYYKISSDVFRCPKCFKQVALLAGLPMATPRDDFYETREAWKRAFFAN